MKYDKYIVAFSGGKDSTACFLNLLDQGIDKSKIELWHNDIDGDSGHFFDWPITKDYCRAFAEAFGVKIYFSWKQGGFYRELMRDNQRTAPMFTETPYGNITSRGGTRGKLSTRKKFPQVSSDLSVRWCSAYLKIDVCAAAIRMQKRFIGLKTCIISGERGEESAARAKYSMNEPDRSDNRGGDIVDRYVDRLRPLRDWTEARIWEIIEKYKVRVHPCYYLRYSRCSCMHCIFGNKDQFATSAYLDPCGIQKIINIEKDSGLTIKRNKSVPELIHSGIVYDGVDNKELSKLSMSEIYTDKIIIKKWELPSGAYGNSCGPS
ncbi:hypothetical protein LCGC14_0337360 [marine sediment metagenome]|uniref:Phosphoadenosine phosphosulphate reductase domain-containing protein n=1 Tax=marine sediment metagenome TaxID=412755 RepID=A0A0F9TKA4_9ZZZZ